MEKFKRVFLIVLDSLGAGALPDAAEFGDEGAHTLLSLSLTDQLFIPHLRSLGIGSIEGLGFLGTNEFPKGAVCKLSEESYRSFIEGLDSFSITKDGETHYLLKNEEAFSYPAYIIQWVAPGHKNEALEYILLDDENQTVIFVYFADFP